MNRREALSRASLLLGGTIIGANVFLSGCKSTAKDDFFTNDDLLFLDEIGETIIPSTSSSPGAKAAHIGLFMKTIVSDCYSDVDAASFKNGMRSLQARTEVKLGKEFASLLPTEKHTLLLALNKEALTYNSKKSSQEPFHYFTMMKQLTIWGYFTSEPGATKALRYLPVPGYFEGCIPYSGEPSWAT